MLTITRKLRDNNALGHVFSSEGARKGFVVSKVYRKLLWVTTYTGERKKMIVSNEPLIYQKVQEWRYGGAKWKRRRKKKSAHPMFFFFRRREYLSIYESLM